MYGNTPGERSSEGQITSFTTKYRRDIYLWLYLTPPPPPLLCKGSGIRETFVCGYVDFGIWNLKYRSLWREWSGRSVLTNGKCPKFTATVKESGIEYLESGIYSVESRIQDYLKQHSHLVPGHGAQIRYSLGNSVNTPFFKVVPQEFGYGAWARVEPTPFL